MLPKIFLNSRESNITLNRICCQLNEKHYPWNNSVIVGLQPRGVELANVILKRLKNDFLINDILRCVRESVLAEKDSIIDWGMPQIFVPRTT